MAEAAEVNNDYLGMSDMDFLNSNPAQMEDAEEALLDGDEEELTEDTEAVAEGVEVEVGDTVEETDEDDSDDEDDVAEEDEESDAETDDDEEAPTETDDETSSEETDEETQEEDKKDEGPDLKGFFEKVTGEFKANGKAMKVDNPDDIIRLMQMGANYNRKMAALKPNMKLLKMMEKADILTEEKLSFLIDLNQKDPKAITKLLADSNVDPMDLNLEEAGDYKASDHSIDEREIDLDAVIDEIRDTTTFNKTVRLVSNEWDDFSKQAVANEPQLLRVLNDHMASGVYDLISTEIEQERVLGRLNGKSDIEAYQEMGDAMAQQGAFDHLFQQNSPTPVTKPAPSAEKKAAESKRRSKRRAASPAKPAAPTTPKNDFNPLGMSDEEFLAQSDPKFL